MEFEEVREYQAGDDIRSIDWNVTARMGHPFVKRYVEERELTVVFLVDLSASGAFGSSRRLKNEVAAELCALLAFSAIKNNDKVGLVVFTDAIERFIPPGKGTTHVLRLIREVLGFRPKQVRTNIAAALEYVNRVTTKRSVIFVVSDFQGEGYQQALRILNRRHDVVAVSITDPREVRMPDVGLIELEDAETGELVTLDTGSAHVRRQYESLGRERQKRMADLFRASRVDQIDVFTDRDYVRDLVRFFRARERRSQG
jgi:uncharacterized protein (DUF58 family)